MLKGLAMLVVAGMVVGVEVTVEKVVVAVAGWLRGLGSTYSINALGNRSITVKLT
jgi:hypothetical protein